MPRERVGNRTSLAAVVLALALLASCGRRPAATPEPPPPPARQPSVTRPPDEEPPPKSPKPTQERKPATKKEASPEPPKPSPFPKPIPEPPTWQEGHFESGVYRNSAGLELPYRLYLPAVCEQPCPLILYLHSASGRGDDNETQINGSRRWGAAFWTSDEVQMRHSAFVVIPQADPKLAPTWVRKWRRDPSDPPSRAEPLELAIELVEGMKQDLPVDARRIYVTGFSMGGFGAWIAISRHPELFAAAAPIAGGGDPTDVAEARSAVWAFHGSKDTIVPVSRTRSMIEALRKAGAHPRYTEYPGKGHFIIREALAEPELVDWLFAQKAGWLP